ncbi:CocE/NonD family hydrolase [Actinocorallia sp. A-T 12471]|uniref:CocE/NonD family hydrolase n=1 Tax=Actinocorallia sp. A-T 12471 TaxID=3089813 RepID=UPI0029D254D7|nr:CocE/NonD family hydrolase [Actinocorallia sp. A-T 12471]MDX6742306.1 CocE/NonD family hydrolase [Actinocorallia sp. A-T 12471]
MSDGPEIVTDLPHEVEIREHVLVKMRDGVAVSLKLWLPADAEAAPVPAVLEAMPYRKDDVALADDHVRMAYVAGHGYTCARMDLRGSGNSEGVLTGEYHPQEQEDIAEVIAWLADQPWCSGEVGLTGMSWSGCNTLHVAARRPPALRAAVSVYSSDDHYGNDIHYMGGAVLAFYLAVWGHVMLSFNARTPDPAVVGDAWRALWLERLAANAPFSAERIGHQRRDAYWTRFSVRDDPAAIEVPTLVVGGWADAYTESALRLLRDLPGTRRGIVGPWGHTWPERAVPGPSIGFLQETVRWWDRWLKGVRNGVENEPLLRWFAQDTAEPRADLTERTGRWHAAAAVPAPGSGDAWHLTASGLDPDGPGDGGTVAHSSPLTLGSTAGSWLPYGTLTDLPTDQRADDALSLTFDSRPLAEDTVIFGEPALDLVVSSDKPVATVIARLCAVAPDGTSSLVSRGVLNLTHRDGHAEPAPLEPGREYRVRVPLGGVGERVPAGHRLRVAVSTQYWPWIWPAPELPTVTVRLAEGSRLLLPTTTPDPSDDVAFGPPQTAAPPPVTSLREHRPEMTPGYDPETGRHTFRLVRDLNGDRVFPSGLRYADDELCDFAIREGDPLSASVEMDRTIRIERGDWRTRVRIRTRMTGTATEFHLRSRVTAWEGDAEVFDREYTRTAERDNV